MSKGMIYKFIFILFLVVISVLLILPTVGSKQMEVSFSDKAEVSDIENVVSWFSDEGYDVERDEDVVIVRGSNITDAIMNEIKILPGVSDVKVLKHWVEEVFLAKKISLGLDLQGGMHLVLQANFEGIQEKLGRELTEKDRNEITQQALELLRNRIDKFGVSEPSIRPRGNEAIEIQLPGVKDPEGVKNAIGTTGSLEYRIVDDKYTELATKLYKEKYSENGVPTEETAHLEFVRNLGKEIGLPSDLEILFFYSRDKETGEIYPDYPIALSREISLAGTDIQEAVVDRDEYGQIIVMFRTTAEGAAKFARATSEPNHGKRLAIVLDNKVRNAPSIRETIASGSGNISGGFTYDEAVTLARIIKEGALPVDLRIIEERTVGPSLGQDSIESGVKAGIIGLIGVMCFMLLYYKAAGIIANLGLALNMVFMLALLSLLGFTLTLPGIAGFILTVGMAVDANVIIYERIKEELKKGKSVRMAIVSGYDRAFWTVFDANLTTMIAAFILSQFGTGPIKGFAVTLFIGILTSMFTALYVTRFIYELISLNKKIKKLYI
jgi:preprotein translocase subunit SecD